MANVIRDLPSSASYFEVLPSAARTTAPDTQEFRVDRRGFGPTSLVLTIDATAITATPALTVTVSGVDPVSGKIYTILASTAIATAVTTVLKIGPGLTAAANLVANDVLPPNFRITCAHGDSDSITYSVGGMLV
jgi:hypothetical protein